MAILDFFKKKKESKGISGFDTDGYNQLGFDRMGYDRDGYDINGFNRAGFDRNGVNKHTGLDANGYDREGYNADGYDRDGYDRDGYDKKGFDPYGYDRNGYNKAGYDTEGYNREGYDADGYNREGFNKKGFNRAGYDREGFDVKGYDQQGYNREGFNRDGYDRDGYNKKGYDKDGFDRNGLNKAGYDRDGYDADGFDKTGFDRKGFDKSGFDADGYDSEGYDRKGFNRKKVTRLGCTSEEFDDDGYHKQTGFDAFGFNRYGYSVNGINKYTGRDRLGFDKDGIDELGYNIWGFNPDTGVGRNGKTIEEYEGTANFSDEKMEAFESMYMEFMAGKASVAVKLANCYFNGIGTIKDYTRMFLVLFDAAYEFGDRLAARDLSDFFFIGQIIDADPTIAQYLQEIADNKQGRNYYQFKARQALEFSKPTTLNADTLSEERRHLAKVLSSIGNQISYWISRITKLDSETWWMDSDQRKYWQEQKKGNIQAQNYVDDYRVIESNPYYARMDMETLHGRQIHYIGERAYMDSNNPAIRISSVWSDVGRAYRSSVRNAVLISGIRYDVSLKRTFTIQDGELLEYFDEHVEGSEAAQAKITDPYLLRILESKRGEKNITNIIRSIQSNQNDIIEEDITKNIIVQGCAGSGKTMILLHRLANLKYNNPSFDWKKVKILTPNKDFELFIDDLSKNLQIGDIEKTTLQEYYLLLLERYQNKYPTRVIDSKTKAVSHRHVFSLTAERKKLLLDSDWDIQLASTIYSAEFAKVFADLIQKWQNEKTIEDYETAMDCYDEVFKQAIEVQAITPPKKTANYTCVLYAKALLLYNVFGPLTATEKMLCVDEGQDICEAQYSLLYNINNRNTALNIYGDLSQRLPDNVNISSWSSLSELLCASYYELNENYRNSQEIIEFYNRELGVKNNSFGLKSKPVQSFDITVLGILLKLHLLLGNRVVIITNTPQELPGSILNMCAHGIISENRASVMTVRQVKGMEFDVAFVFEQNMDQNERYISFTRALSELYVFRNLKYKYLPYALGLKDELASPNAIKSVVDISCFEEGESPSAQTAHSSSKQINDQDLDTASNLYNKYRKHIDGPFVIVRNTWYGDYCFVVDEFLKNNTWVRGRTYRNGVYERTTNYRADTVEFRMYNGPSAGKIK